MSAWRQRPAPSGQRRTAQTKTRVAGMQSSKESRLSASMRAQSGGWFEWIRFSVEKPAERSATTVQVAAITAAWRKPLRTAGASARAGAARAEGVALRTEAFIGKCSNLSANALAEQS